MKSLFFKIVTLALLITFIFIKVINVHNLSHLTDDNNTTEDCQYCEFYSVSEKTNDLDFPPSAIKIPENTTHYLDVEYRVSYQSTIFTNTSHSGGFHNRPPPIFL